MDLYKPPRPSSSSWRSPRIRLREREATPKGFLHDDAEKSKPLLARHIGQLISEPKETQEGPVYEVSGDMDVLPARSDVMQVVARAGSRSQCYRRGQRPRGEPHGRNRPRPNLLWTLD